MSTYPPFAPSPSVFSWNFLCTKKVKIFVTIKVEKKLDLDDLKVYNNIDTIIEVLSIKQRQNVSNISDEEANKIYAAIKLIENLYKQNLIKEHVFKNIVKEYSNCVDLSNFR